MDQRAAATTGVVQQTPCGGLARLGRAGLFAAGCAIIILVSGSGTVPSGVPRGAEYLGPAAYVVAAAKGTIALPRENNPAGGEDIGYLVLRQAWVLMGGGGSYESIVELHNVFVLGCALAFATTAALMMRSLLAGWLALALALVLRYALRGVLFGAIDNRTFIIFFPLALSLIVVLVGSATRMIPRPVGVLAAVGIGGIIGMADLVRQSEGMPAFYAVALACLLVIAPLWKRAVTVALIVLGTSLMTYAVPMGVRLFNDVHTGRYEGRILPYLRPVRPSRHGAWHSLQISLGRYPNPEELQYRDWHGLLVVKNAYPELVARVGDDEAARAYYLWYVRTHPLAWLHYVARGMLEVFYFIPYTTSVGSYPWALGNLPAKEGIVPDLIVDPRDVACDPLFQHFCHVGYGSLVNLRWRYLRLGIFDWLLFLASLALLPAALRAAHRAGDAENRRVFLSLLFYLGLGVVTRALIPAYGQALVVAYWGVSILALIYLGFGWRSPRRSAS